MATDYELMRGTVNEALGNGPALARAYLKSSGFNPNGGPDMSPPEDPGKCNGGISCKRISRIEKGDLLFRFSGRHCRTLEQKCVGEWWFDKECFDTIRRASRLENADFVATARSFLGILWKETPNLIGGKARADFWCYKGLTGSVEGPRQRFSDSPRTDIVQMFVPGGLQMHYLTEIHDDVLKSGITL